VLRERFCDALFPFLFLFLYGYANTLLLLIFLYVHDGGTERLPDSGWQWFEKNKKFGR